MDQLGLCVLVAVICNTSVSGSGILIEDKPNAGAHVGNGIEQLRHRRAFKTLAETALKLLMKGAVKLHDRPPSDVSFIKFGGQTAFKKDYMAIKSDIHTLSAKGRLIDRSETRRSRDESISCLSYYIHHVCPLQVRDEVKGEVYGKIVGDRLIQKYDARFGFPPQIVVWKIKEGETGVKLMDGIKIKYLSRKGHKNLSSKLEE